MNKEIVKSAVNQLTGMVGTAGCGVGPENAVVMDSLGKIQGRSQLYFHS